MYPWLVFIHVLSVLTFVLMHGASVSVAFALRKEPSLEQIRALLMLSANSYQLMYPSLLVIVLSGIGLGFAQSWWGSGWIWLSLVLLIVLLAAMNRMGGVLFGAARKAAGLPYFDKGKVQPPQPAGSMEEIKEKINQINPISLTVLGYGGLAVITWLMLFKPF